MAGVAADAQLHTRRDAAEPGDLHELFRRQDRSEALEEMHRRAVVAALERKHDGAPPPG